MGHIFISYSRKDEKYVRKLIKALEREGLEVWFDRNMGAGAKWEQDIEKHIEECYAFIVVMSDNAKSSDWVRREVLYAINTSREIFPLLLQGKLLMSLQDRNYVDVTDGVLPDTSFFDRLNRIRESVTSSNKLTFSNGMEFMRVPAGEFLMGGQHPVEISYDYWMARFPITNEQYSVYLNSVGSRHPVDYWESKKTHPVVFVSWYEAMEYCQWLNNLLRKELPSGLIFRLPDEDEWEKSACGTDGRRYPWGRVFEKNKCNSKASDKGGTTPVDFYSPDGDSPYGCADIIGNVKEWTQTHRTEEFYYMDDPNDIGWGYYPGFVSKEEKYYYDDEVMVTRSSSWEENPVGLFTESTKQDGGADKTIGFRVCLAPPSAETIDDPVHHGGRDRQ